MYVTDKDGKLYEFGYLQMQDEDELADEDEMEESKDVTSKSYIQELVEQPKVIF